jgi:hypothetical protein
MNVTRDKFNSFRDWVTDGRNPESPLSVVEALKSEQAQREYPNIHWSRLQLLIIGWADEMCSESLRGGATDFYADISNLFARFSRHWNAHKLDFFSVYPSAQSWTNEQLGFLPECIFEILLNELTKPEGSAGSQMVQPYDRQRIRSHAYELAYYLLCLRQRLDAQASIGDQPKLTHMLKVYSSARSRPKREVKFIDAIRDYLLDIRYRDLASPDWEIIQQHQGREWLLEIWDSFLDQIKIPEVAPFQLKCFRTLLDSALLADANPDPVMITAGTGFGKTEAFLFPILFYSTVNLLRQTHQSYGPDAVMVYPRIDLCNDQLERYMWYAHCLKTAVNLSPNTDLILNFKSNEMYRVALGHSGVKTEDSDEAFKIVCPECRSVSMQNGVIQNGVIKVKQEPGSFKKIPYCTENSDHRPYQSLIPEISEWNRGRFTVAITTVDTLHRRLMDVHGRKTLWKSTRNLPRFIILDEIHIYEGQTGSHVSNLARRLKVYLKNIHSSRDVKLPNPHPPIFVGASATIGNPEKVGSAIFGVSASDIASRVIKPGAEESEALGREYTYLIKTPTFREIHDESRGRNRLRIVSEQTSLLQALMAFWHAMRKTLPQPGIPGKYRLLTFVDSIDSVWRITQNLDDAESHSTKQLFRFRMPRGRWTKDENVNGNPYCPKFSRGELCTTPPHHFFETCGVYQEGECWWSMGESSDEFLRPMHVVGRISGFTKSPPNFPTGQSLDQWDCMISTSTLEVGFDHSELIATAQFKAPPNPASFQQRKGRGGRSIEDIPLTLMVLGNSPGDLFAFRNEKRYFEPSSEDLSIHFDAYNQFIRNQHAFSAVFDFLSWKGITQSTTNIHKQCDIHSVLEHIEKNRIDFNNWMIDLYAGDGLSRNECLDLVTECLNQLKNSIVPLSYYIPGVYNSLDLFRKELIPPNWIFDLQYRIDQGDDDPTDKKTMIVLRAAERWKKSYLHPPNYFNLLPVDAAGLPRDPSWVIPETFIPTPIGGSVTVEGHGSRTITEIEPKLQTLANFLPGGYKHRWGFDLWFGEWLPALGQPNSADISNIARDAEELGKLEDRLGGRPVPSALVRFDSQETYLINPRTIQVQTGQEHFFLTPSRDRVKHPSDGPGGIRLSREPSSSMQTYDLITEHNGNRLPLLLEGNPFGIESVNFGEWNVLRLFYSNLVNCYPSDILNKPQPSLSINLNFFDGERRRATIPTVNLRAQGILLEGSLSQLEIHQKISACRNALTYEEHFWRMVYRLIWRDAFLNRDLEEFKITFSFDCIKVLKVLRFIDSQTRINQKRSLESLSQTEFESAFESSRILCQDFYFDLFQGTDIIDSIPGSWGIIRDGILKRARSEIGTEIVESFAQSLTMSICRDVASKTNINLDLLKASVEVFIPKQSNHYSFRACVYDNVEGGNGTVASYVNRINTSISLDAICAKQKGCRTDLDETEILLLFQDSSFNADRLYSFAKTSGELTKRGLSDQAAFKISRLISSPSITAFYQGVAENYQLLKELLLREPGEEELACWMEERPIADPRGNLIFEKFKAQSGGISELIPRIAEIMPLCQGSCPDCLGDSRLSFEKGETFIADRHTLGV